MQPMPHLRKPLRQTSVILRLLQVPARRRSRQSPALVRLDGEPPSQGAPGNRPPPPRYCGDAPDRPSVTANGGAAGKSTNIAGSISDLRIHQLQLVGRSQHQRSTGLRTDAQPVDGSRKRLRAIGLDSEVEAALPERLDQGVHRPAAAARHRSERPSCLRHPVRATGRRRRPRAPRWSRTARRRRTRCRRTGRPPWRGLLRVPTTDCSRRSG